MSNRKELRKRRADNRTRNVRSRNSHTCSFERCRWLPAIEQENTESLNIIVQRAPSYRSRLGTNVNERETASGKRHCALWFVCFVGSHYSVANMCHECDVCVLSAHTCWCNEQGRRGQQNSYNSLSMRIIKASSGFIDTIISVLQPFAVHI